MDEMPRIVSLALAIDECPTVAQIDEMLMELRGMEASDDVATTIDELLELRASLAAAA